MASMLRRVTFVAALFPLIVSGCDRVPGCGDEITTNLVLDIVKRKDVAELWDAGVNLDMACENCHRSYWYPKEDAEFYRKLREKVEEHERTHPVK